MARAKAVYFINQFFAGVGGEDKADFPLEIRPEALGPAKRFQELSGDAFDIVTTVYCGDNHFADYPSATAEAIIEAVRTNGAAMFVAGPAFGSGRYGYACAELCHRVTAALGIPCLSAMAPGNPGVELYQQYKDREVYFLPTGETISGMGKALEHMAHFAQRLIAGAAIGTAADEGYMPRGIRVAALAPKRGVERAIDMMLAKVAGRDFVSEIPIETVEQTPIAAAIRDLKQARLALVSTAGVVAPGNPDGFKTNGNTQWRKYAVDQIDSMTDAPWDVWHGGYNTVFMHDNPNYGVPLDSCREFEKAGGIGKVHPYFYSIPGSFGQISIMQNIGREILSDMKEEGVSGALLVST